MGKSKELFSELLGEMADLAIQYDNGDIELLDCLTKLEDHRAPLEAGLNLIKHFKDENINRVADAASEYKDGYRGWLIEVRGGGRMLNYKSIEEWQEVDSEKKRVEKKYKTMLDARIAGNVNANISEDGEELTLPEVSYRKSSLIMKAKK